MDQEQRPSKLVENDAPLRKPIGKATALRTHRGPASPRPRALQCLNRGHRSASGSRCEHSPGPAYTFLPHKFFFGFERSQRLTERALYLFSTFWYIRKPWT